MKKVGASFVLLMLLFSIALITAANETNSTTPTELQQNPDKIEKGFECLEKEAKDCADLTTQEIALTIFATPDNIFDYCVAELKKRQTSDNWGDIRDTALAILALKHAGEDTEAAEAWLLKQEKTPTDLIWYLQQDSNVATECHIGYESNDYIINVGANKKIDRNAGTCLTRAQSNFWLQVAPDCYEKEFTIECDQAFIATLIYKNKNSPTIYVLEGTDSEPAFGSIKLDVKSKCFGKNSCDYEATVWATLALLETGHNIEDFIPYIVAMSDTNKQYLPEAFIYMLTNYEDYATQLVADQKLGNYWEAPASAYNRYYDTAIALVALGSSSSEQITKAKDWLLFSQGTNGCWQNSVKETATVLWALTGRSGKTSGGGSTTTYCSEAKYFCIPRLDCPANEDVGKNYFCPSQSTTCCMNENLKSCSGYNGKECSTSEICVGNSRKATDTTSCCTGECKPRPQETECEKNFYTCMNQCSEFQEPVTTYSCNLPQVCCRTKTTPGGSSWWIWILVILIIIILAAIAYIFRDKLKLLWFKIKTKFKKDKGPKDSFSRGGPGMPPRPGFPPIRRPYPPVAPVRRPQQSQDTTMSETFKKLKEMSS
ncbi:MAG: hypothetical protein V1889_01195 [archaeon]